MINTREQMLDGLKDRIERSNQASPAKIKQVLSSLISIVLGIALDLRELREEVQQLNERTGGPLR